MLPNTKTVEIVARNLSGLDRPRLQIEHERRAVRAERGVEHAGREAAGDVEPGPDVGEVEPAHQQRGGDQHADAEHDLERRVVDDVEDDEPERHADERGDDQTACEAGDRRRLGDGSTATPSCRD